MKVQIYGLILNLIVYILMIIPVLIISFRKSNYISKKNLIKSSCLSIVIGIIFSIVLYAYSRNIFSIFTDVSGVINYSVYASKILFITSSLYTIKYFIPIYFWKNNYQKKATILVISKIVVNIIFMLIGYFLFSTKGFLFSFPLCDLIYYIIYILNIIW